MPLTDAARAYHQRWVFEAEGVGLLAVDDRGRVRCPIPARQSPRLLPFVREKVLEAMHARLTPPEPSIEGHGPWIVSLIPSEVQLIRLALLKVYEQATASP